MDLKEEDVAVLSDGHGNTVRCVECQGHFLSAPAVENGRIPDPRKNFPLLRNLQLRPDDVFLLAYPKAGSYNKNQQFMDVLFLHKWIFCHVKAIFLADKLKYQRELTAHHFQRICYESDFMFYLLNSIHSCLINMLLNDSILAYPYFSHLSW